MMVGLAGQPSPVYQSGVESPTRSLFFGFVFFSSPPLLELIPSPTNGVYRVDKRCKGTVFSLMTTKLRVCCFFQMPFGELIK